MSLSENQIRAALAQVRYPGFSRDIVSFGLVQKIELHEEPARVAVALRVTTADPEIPAALKSSVENALCALPGIAEAQVEVEVVPPAGRSTPGAATQSTAPIPGVRHVIAVASGKGGVGKSTVAANLAVALQRRGLKIGLCDCDLYGPSIALMFGSHQRPFATEENVILPIEACGLKLMSMGFLLDDGSPAALRGPMVTRYTQQFLRQVEWGELDCLLLDLPPGTGDIQLTIVQTVALSGAIIVTTPQEVALIDARKAVGMFEKVNVPILGLVENMSYFLCPSDGQRYDIFGSGGGAREAKRLHAPLLGELPIDMATREAGDRGVPIMAAAPESGAGRAYAEIARAVAERKLEPIK